VVVIVVVKLNFGVHSTGRDGGDSGGDSDDSGRGGGDSRGDSDDSGRGCCCSACCAATL